MTPPETDLAPKNPEEDFERAKSAINKEADAAKDQLRHAGDRLRDEASLIANKAKDAVSERAHEGKETVAAGMTDFAAAVRRASEELGQRDQSIAANLVRQVASGLEDASSAIHGRSVGDLTRSVSDFARRQPATFLLGATVAGIALGRFIKASDSNSATGEAAPDAVVPSAGTPGSGATSASRPAAGASPRPGASTTKTTSFAGGATTGGAPASGGSRDR